MDSKLFDILVCPSCKGKLIYNKERAELICNFEKLAFPIKDNIPVLLVSAARKISSSEVKK